MEAVPGLLRAASFRRRRVSSCSGLRITDPPAAWAARPLGLTALPVRRGRDGEGERESTAGAGEPPWYGRRFTPGAVLGGFNVRLSVIWDRKGAALGVPLIRSRYARESREARSDRTDKESEK